MVAAVQQTIDADLPDGAGHGDGVQHGDDQVAGGRPIDEVNVREGQAVRKGQLLAQIDPAPYQAALAQAQGSWRRTRRPRAMRRRRRRATRRCSRRAWSRRRVQQSQVSTAGQAAGSIKADQAAIQAAKVNVAYTRITSPINGVVGLRQVDAGNIVHACRHKWFAGDHPAAADCGDLHPAGGSAARRCLKLTRSAEQRWRSKRMTARRRRTWRAASC